MNTEPGQFDPAVAYPELAEGKHSIATQERVARMIEINMGYALCYMNGDFEGMMNYLIDEPVFEMHPPSIRFKGREAVLERSRRMHALASQNDLRTTQSHRITAHAADSNTLIHEFSNIYSLGDGTTRRCYTVAVIPYIGDKMVGERIYSDQYLGQMREQLLGPDFLNRPDVTIL
ncbi:MAG: hypothetical protein H6905_04570 [Hyphomicrobiales bacterium]|nr:hypothetical protein [Hyphomicrobiales bacterium]